MRTNICVATVIAVLMAQCSGFFSPAIAEPAAVTVKIGYFSLPQVRSQCHEAAQAELLKTQAEAQLRKAAEEANRAIQKMREDKKGDEEVKAAFQKAQTEIRAKEEALAQLVQSQSDRANAAIARAVGKVAQDRGIDIVVDGQGVFAGGAKFRDSGVDLTKEIVSTLNASDKESGTESK
ncbi:MAG: OmpH family outer membrane protein [Candidatus Melainabacteria bacterium]|nr:OmpH family outer membrane protein [Candidatus Melainabacteria bacterium]